LHQLRGRVGRSHHRAYAFLIVPDTRAITSDAEKRLEAMASLEDLGAGFTLATHDLEIRGAGELLGEQQSRPDRGSRLCHVPRHARPRGARTEAGQVPDFELGSSHEAEIELHLAALIPDDYLPDVNARLTLYKRIASAADDDDACATCKWKWSIASACCPMR
jgi:transcription-repair coupling factor (superfamily II helicase)